MSHCRPARRTSATMPATIAVAAGASVYSTTARLILCLAAAALRHEKCEGLFVVHLPIAAVKKRESLAPWDRQRAIGRGRSAADCRRKRRRDESRAFSASPRLRRFATKSGDDRPALRNMGRVVVGGVKPAPGPCRGKAWIQTFIAKPGNLATAGQACFGSLASSQSCSCGFDGSASLRRHRRHPLAYT